MVVAYQGPYPENRSNPSTHFLNFPSQVSHVEFSPFDKSSSLICVALKDKIVIGTLLFQEEDVNITDVCKFTLLHEFPHESRIHAVAWSPHSSLSVLPKIIEFCSADSQFNITLHLTDLISQNDESVLKGHSDYINCLSYDPEGEILASASDDHSCKLWSVEENSLIATFYLSSPGMSVCWHHQEPSKLLVAEKCGLLRMYNAQTQRAIQSFDAGLSPLAAADWAPSNCLRVACIAGGEIIIWDALRPSKPIEARPIHKEGGRYLRFSPVSDGCVATVGYTDRQMKVSLIGSNQHTTLGTPLQVAGGLSWHCRLPYVCIGSDRKVCLWKVVTN